MTTNGETWTEEDADRFEHAQRLLNELATMLAHQVDAETPITSPEGSGLRAEQLKYLEQQQQLRVTDREEVAALLRDAPERLRQLRQEPRHE